MSKGITEKTSAKLNELITQMAKSVMVRNDTTKPKEHEIKVHTVEEEDINKLIRVLSELNEARKVEDVQSWQTLKVIGDIDEETMAALCESVKQSMETRTRGKAKTNA